MPKSESNSRRHSSQQRIHLRREPCLDAVHRAYVYQSDAVEAIKDLEYAAVFHEQGLGKTKIAIDLMLYWLEQRSVDTVLFVVKKALVHNWLREFKMHTHIRPKVLTQKRGANFYVYNSPARVVLCHYEVFKSDRQRLELFLKARNVAVILDESSKIKNPGAAITKVFLEFSPLFKKRVIMTGTPVANRPQDIWSQVFFLDRGESLGVDFESFRSSVALTKELASDEKLQRAFEGALERVYERISPFAIRETKNSGIITLPKKTIENLPTYWESYQRDLYQRIRNDLRAVVIKEGLPTEDNAGSLLKRLLRLVQITSNPRLVDESYAAEPGKLGPLRDLVDGIMRAGEKCIVWTSFTDSVDWLALEFRALEVCKVHGKISMERRNAAIERFLSDKDARVLVATPGAAKEGLTLTVANHVIFFDRGFSLDDYLQAQDRIHRISQEKHCFVHNFIMQDSIDEWVAVLLHSKHLAAMLTQGDIDMDYYKKHMRYDFGTILRNILGLTQADNRED